MTHDSSRLSVNPYDRWILPRLIDWTMRLGRTLPYRRRMAASARGTVLEVGIGSGANLRCYGSGVVNLYGVDPSPELLRMAVLRVEGVGFSVELLRASSEALPLDSASVDTAVMTFTLCSVFDPGRTLAEVRRVLKPGGVLLFVEHGRSPDAGVARWQDRVTPHWKRLAGGCHLNREPDRLVRDAGLRLERLDAGYAPGPRLLTYFYEGRALKER
jgi:ubiquinone/menaquinone biosynthesis C-methylase UbiE